MPSGIYNLADDEPVSTNELVGLIKESLGHRPRYWKFPKWMVRLLARCGDVLPLPLNSHRLQKLTESYIYAVFSIYYHCAGPAGNIPVVPPPGPPAQPHRPAGRTQLP